MPRRSSLRARLAAHGFEYRQTGGNCTAYIRDGGDVEEVITSTECELTVPIRSRERVCVWTGPVGESDDRGDTCHATMAEVLAALDHPTQEYHLLSLRLYNLVKAGA